MGQRYKYTYHAELMKRTLNSAENTRLAEWLKLTRTKKGLSTTELGKKLGTPHTFVSKVERQERRLDVVEYLTYCKALDVDPIEGITAINSKEKSW